MEQRFEHEIIERIGIVNTREVLKTFEKRGWELVSTNESVIENNDYYTLFLKRPNPKSK